jgi:hypothetical protein
MEVWDCGFEPRKKWSERKWRVEGAKWVKIW